MSTTGYPLRALRTLMTRAAPVQGVVTRIAGQEVEVATERGLVSARASGSLSVGAAVTLRDGVAVRRAVATASYPL